MIEAPIRIEVDILTIPMFEDLADMDSLDQLEQDLEIEAFIESYANSRVLEFRYAFFTSKSRGKSRGRKRKPAQEKIPRSPREVELVQLSFDRYVTYKDGGGKLDRYCPSGMTEEELMTEGRRPNHGLDEYGLKIKDGSLVPR